MSLLLEPVGRLLRGWFVSEECFTTLFVNANLFDQMCLKAFISKGLGFAMTAFSAIVKMPQVVTMLRNKTAVGVSRTAVYIETIMYGACATYGVIVGNPFSAYGENVMLIIQNLMIISLTWRFSETSIAEIVAVLALFGTLLVGALQLPAECGPVEACVSAVSAHVASLTGGGAAEESLALGPCTSLQPCQSMLIASSIPLMLSSRVPQVIANFRNGHTGVLSPVTLFANLLGSTARIFTTIQEAGGDVGMLASFGTSVLMNFVMFSQVVLYRGATKKVMAEHKKKKAA